MTRRKSEAEKRRTGTQRRDRVHEPVEAPVIEPLMPAHLPDDAKAVWRSLAPALVEAELLTSLDGSAFGLVCRLIAHFDECYAEGKIPSRDMIAQYRPLPAAFGLTPDARQKLGKPAPEQHPKRGFDID